MKKIFRMASVLFFVSFVMTGWAVQPDIKVVRAPQRVTEAGKKVSGVTRLFILSGQSNMAGMDETQKLIPTVEKAFPDDELIFVKDSASGQPIRLWYKDWKPVGDWTPRDARSKPGNNVLYRRLMASVKLAIEGKNIQSVTFIWMQGEADAKSSQSENYESSLRGLIQQVRDDLNRKDVYAVVGRLSDHLNGDPHWDRLRQAQVNVATTDPLVGWIDTDDFNGKSNGLHYDRNGYTKLGEAFAEKAVEQLR